MKTPSCGFCHVDADKIEIMLASEDKESYICVDCVIKSINSIMMIKPGLIEFNIDLRKHTEPLDDCNRCKGSRGGIPGDEHLMPDGEKLCDFCFADITIDPHVCECNHSQADHVANFGRDERGCTMCQCIEYQERV